MSFVPVKLTTQGRLRDQIYLTGLLSVWKGQGYLWPVIRGNLTNGNCPESREHRVVQEVPPRFMWWGMEPSSILVSLWIMWPLYSHSWFCYGSRNYFFLQVDFLYTPFSLLARKSLLTVRGSCGNKRMKEKAGRQMALLCYLGWGPTTRQDTQISARPLSCSSPTSAAYIHPMHRRSCCYHSAPHKTTSRWKVLYD